MAEKVDEREREEKLEQELKIRLREGVAKRIVKLRESKGLTQKMLAAKLGYSNQTAVSKTESGRYYTPSYESAVKYAIALNSTPEYILFGLESSLDFMDTATMKFVCDKQNYELIRNLRIDTEIKKLQAEKTKL